MWCGNFFHSIADWMARIADFGTGLCPARLRYVAPSNSCHSCRQSMLPAADDAGVVAVAMDAPSESILFYRSRSMVRVAGRANKSQIGKAVRRTEGKGIPIPGCMRES